MGTMKFKPGKDTRLFSNVRWLERKVTGSVKMEIRNRVIRETHRGVRWQVSAAGFPIGEAISEIRFKPGRASNPEHKLVFVSATQDQMHPSIWNRRGIRPSISNLVAEVQKATIAALEDQTR